MRHLNSYAAIGWSSTADAVTDRVHALAVPLRDLEPEYSRPTYRAESLDRTVIESLVVGSGAHEMTGSLRYDDDPQGVVDILKAGAAGVTLTYYPDVRDPGVVHACKLIAPVGAQARAALEQARSGFGNVAVPIRLRRTDQKPFSGTPHGTGVIAWIRGGGNLDNWTFGRSSTTTRFTNDGAYGNMGSVASGKVATSWYDLDADSKREAPGFDLLPQAINLCLQSENFGTTWVAVGTPVRTGGSVVVGTLSLDTLEDDAAGTLEGYTQTIAFTGNAVKALSLFVGQGTSTSTAIRLRDTTAGTNRLLGVVTWNSNGTPAVAMTTGSYLGTERLAGDRTNTPTPVFRLLFQATSVTAANTNSLEVYPATDAALGVAGTGTVFSGGVQAEDAPVPGAYVPTTVATVTRLRDVYSLTSLGAVPGATSFYVRFIERGGITQSVAGTESRILRLSEYATAQISIDTAAGFYRLRRRTVAGAFLDSTAASAPVYGDRVELLGVLNADGSVALTQAVNDTAVTAATSTVTALDGRWGNTNLYLGNESGTGNPLATILNVVIMRGVASLATARSAADL